MLPKIGLIVEADEPALFYADPTQAELDLEAVDVEGGVFKSAFGPAGECYAISTEDGRISIERDWSRPPQPERLKEVLLKFLFAIGASANENESLGELLERCRPFLERNLAR